MGAQLQPGPGPIPSRLRWKAQSCNGWCNARRKAHCNARRKAHCNGRCSTRCKAVRHRQAADVVAGILTTGERGLRRGGGRRVRARATARRRVQARATAHRWVQARATAHRRVQARATACRRVRARATAGREVRPDCGDGGTVAARR